MADSFSFGGTDLSGASYGVTIAPFEEPWLPQPLTHDIKPLTGEPRSEFIHHDSQQVVLQAWVKGTSIADLRSKRDALAKVLNPELGEQKLQIDQIPGRYWIAKLARPLRSRQLGEQSGGVEFVFDLMGLAYSDSQTSNSSSIATDPDTIQETVSEAPEVNAVHYIRNSTGADVSSIQVSVAEIGDTFKWNGTLGNGLWLRIGSFDSLGRYKYTLDKSTAGGADPTALTYADELANIPSDGGDWPRLKGNTTNNVTITGVSAGTYQVVYRDRYLGG